MKEHPCKCILCQKPILLEDDGSHVDEVYVYQRIDGKLKLATDIVLHTPMYFAHAMCE